jgi:hypothetical protein
MPPVAESKRGFQYLGPNGNHSNAIRDRAFSGSEPKFAAPSARPAGASHRNGDPTPKNQAERRALG